MAALGSYILFYTIYSLIIVRFPDKAVFCAPSHTISYPQYMSIIRRENSRKFHWINTLRRGYEKYLHIITVIAVIWDCY